MEGGNISRALSSTIQRLRSELEDIATALASLVEISPVEYFDRHAGSLVVVGPADYYFVKPREDQLRLQIPLRLRYMGWFERFSLLYPDPPERVDRAIKQAHRHLLGSWIELGSNYCITHDQRQNALKSREAFAPFFELLEVLDGAGETVVVPDTNALVLAPDPLAYTGIAATEKFLFVLLPTVLAELDNLKNFAREPAFRQKIVAVIRRIKGWRNQGSLVDGVTLHKTITVRAVAEEPQADQSLSWLDPTNRDDRIISSVLELQSAEPRAQICLVTADVNLQNKADAAKLPCSEPPRGDGASR